MALVEGQLRDDREKPVGLVHVTAPIFFGERAVVPAVTRLLSDHPGLKVRLLLLDRPVDLVQEHIDIGVRIGHLEDSSLTARRIGCQCEMLCASPAFLECYGRPSHPARSCRQALHPVQRQSCRSDLAFQRRRQAAASADRRTLHQQHEPAQHAGLCGGLGLRAFLQPSGRGGDPPRPAALIGGKFCRCRY